MIEFAYNKTTITFSDILVLGCYVIELLPAFEQISKMMMMMGTSYYFIYLFFFVIILCFYTISNLFRYNDDGKRLLILYKFFSLKLQDMPSKVLFNSKNKCLI
jgi:hypothetical protein